MRLSTCYKACFKHGLFVAVPQSTNYCLMPGQLAKDMLTGRTLQFSSKADLEKGQVNFALLSSATPTQEISSAGDLSRSSNLMADVCPFSKLPCHDLPLLFLTCELNSSLFF